MLGCYSGAGSFKVSVWRLIFHMSPLEKATSNAPPPITAMTFQFRRIGYTSPACEFLHSMPETASELR